MDQAPLGPLHVPDDVCRRGRHRAIASNATASSWATQHAAFDPFITSLTAMVIAQVAFGVLGLLAISSEHTTGMIRTTFAAIPRRRSVLAAKAAVAGAVALAAGMITAFASFLIGQALLSGTHASASLSTPGALRAVLGAGCYMLIVTLIGFGLGAIIRHTAGAITALFGLVLVLPSVATAFPAPWNTRIERLLPDFHAVVAQHPVQGMFSPGVSLLVCAAWAVAALGVAGFLVTCRDA